VPSSNGAAVVIVHGGGGDRTGAVAHARLLARHGFGVLLYDARGRGESEGSPNAFGWGWEDDVEGALDFVATRAGVDRGRIGGLGLSTGADVLLQVAARDRRLGAVVSDGASGESFADYRTLKGIDVSAPYWWTLYSAARVFSPASPGEPLRDAVSRIAPTPLLLIATGGSIPEELDFNRIYARAAKQPVALWELPTVTHTAAIRERPLRYERRVVGFFTAALIRDEASGR
jgi:pimeloyl-ACP methyl ester carboxylesterase